MKHGMDTGNPLFRLFLPVLAGCILGSVLFARYAENAIWQSCLLRQGLGAEVAVFPAMLGTICAVPLFWLLCTAVCGTSLAAAPLAYGLLCLRGMALGAVLCGVYIQQAAAGVLTALLFIMPYALCSTILFAAGAREALRFSTVMMQILRNQGETMISVRMYAIRFLVLAVLLAAAGLLQCLWLKYGYAGFLDLMTGK